MLHVSNHANDPFLVLLPINGHLRLSRVPKTEHFVSSKHQQIIKHSSETEREGRERFYIWPLREMKKLEILVEVTKLQIRFRWEGNPEGLAEVKGG